MTVEDLLAEVNNPATLPERLEQLWFGFPYPQQKPGYHGSHAIRRRIAAHPNLTPRLAGRALGKYPEVVCANPVFPLLMLETPHLMKLVPPNDMLAWLKRESCPRLFVELMLGKNWPLVSEAAKRHVSYTGYVSRDELLDVLRTELIEMPKANDDKSLEVLHEVGLVPQSIAEHLGLGDTEPRPTLLPVPIVVPDPDEEPLTEREDWEIRACLDDNGGYRWGRGWEKIRGLASRPDTKVAVLRRLGEVAIQANSGLIYDLATNPKTPLEVLIALFRAGNHAYVLVERLADYSLISDQLRRELVAARCRPGRRDNLTEVLALANSPTVQGDHRWLAKAVNWRRRLGLALNPLTSHENLILLAHDGNRLVNAAAKAQLETPGVRLLEQL